MVTTLSSNGNLISVAGAAAAIPVASRLEDLTEDQDVAMVDASEQDSRAELSPSSSKRMRPNPLKYAGLRTGICYDSRMRFHATLDQRHTHPEDPRRIFEIYKRICDAGLVDDPTYEGYVKFNDIMLGIRAREVTMEEAALVHTLEHWKEIERTANMGHFELSSLSESSDSVYFNKESFLCSRLSCGGVIESCIAVVTDRVKNAIAIVRPPGHHAEPDKAMGFCLFNNVAVATKVVQNRYPKCRKVLILDWDVHHGNGTQTAFYADPSVLYISIHRYDGGSFYPCLPGGGMDQCGTDLGLGKNVNIGWESGGMTDGDYMFAFQSVVMPIAMEFNPDLVVVSAGFDAAAGDTIGGCMVSPAGYAHMTHMLMSLAGGKLVVCLEGGYNLSSISESALAVTRVLNGEPPQKLHDGMSASVAGVKVVRQCIDEQRAYWRCMRSANMPPASCRLVRENEKAASLNDVVRYYQARKLWDEHDMSVVSLFVDFDSMSFEYQVLSTTEIDQKKTVILFIHDPPLIWGQPEPHTNHISLHDSILVDVGACYIDWAIKQGFGVFDVNIPLEITGPDNLTYDRVDTSERLLRYIWDNYIATTGIQEVFFFGVGDAAQGLMRFLAVRGPTCRQKVKGVINIIGNGDPFRALVPSMPDDSMLTWYYQNSLIMLSQDHAFWARGGRGTRKKFGLIEKVPADATNEVHRLAFHRTTKWITERLGSEQV